MNRFLPTVLVLLAVLISGCATLSERDAPSVSVVGLEPLESEGLELRFALKLRVQNPNSAPLAYDGMSVSLDLDGRGLASGVSDVSGEIPRFSDEVLTVPVSMSAFSALRQLMARAKEVQKDGDALRQPIAYSLKGKLGATGMTMATRFSDKGEMDLFSSEGDSDVENTN